MDEKNLPKRKKNRLDFYDYHLPGAYFITICTDKRKNLFWAGNVSASCKKEIQLTDYGKIVENHILSISEHYPSVSVDDYVIMPNHLHLLLRMDTDSDGRPMAAPTVATIVNQMKGAVSKSIGFSVWQKGFYDHVVRNERDYIEIIRYIQGNPANWLEDKLYKQTCKTQN